MGALLGYDPQLVAALDASMRRSLAELDVVRCIDSSAATAMRSVHRCASMLRDTWLPFTTGLLGCRAMDGVAPVSPAADDLLGRWSAALVTHAGWQLRTDSAGSPAGANADLPLTAEQAGRLAALLSDPSGRAPRDRESLQWLSRALTHIATDARLTTAFLRGFTTTGWTVVCNALARDRQLSVTKALMYDHRTTSEESAGWAGIDATFAALGTMVAADHRRHPLNRPVLLLEDMTPMAAALLAQHLELDVATLVSLTRSLVQQERILIDRTAETQLGERAADIMFASLLRTPGAPAAYVMTSRDDPSLLLQVAADPAIGVRVATVGTDPANMSRADAATAVPALMGWFLDASQGSSSRAYNPDLAGAAADVMAPYLLPLLRSSSDGWGLSRRMRHAIQDLVMNDDAAFGRLLARRDAIAQALGNPLAGDAGTRIQALRDIADLLALVDTMRRRRAIRHAEDEQAEWDLLWTVVGCAENLVPLRKVASTAVSGIVTVVRAALEAEDWKFGDVPGARAGSLAEFDRLTTVAAAVLVATTFDEMVASGRVASGTLPPPVPELDGPSGTDVGESYSADFGDWLASSGLDSSVVFELAAIKNAIASDHETTADANDVLLGN